MFELDCPYSQFVMNLALISVNEKLNALPNSVQDEIMNGLEHLVPKDITNVDAANHHNISVETLVNSPNYITLKQEYVNHLVNKIIKFFEEKAGLDNKEAWAMLVFSINKGALE